MHRWSPATFLQRAMRVARMAASVAVAGCAAPAVTPAPTPTAVTLADAAVPDNLDPYRGSGFLVGEGAIPFVGQVRYAATEYLDSTAMLVALSIPPRSLSFVRAGDRYAAFYSIRIDLIRGDAILRSDRTMGEVRVASFAETTRGDEGLIFQRAVRVSPGGYGLRVTVEDSLGTGVATTSTSVTVPSLGNGTFSSMIPVFVSEPRTARSAELLVVVNPKATVRYGRDSVVDLYLEAYGPAAPSALMIAATKPGASPRRVFEDSVALSGGPAVWTGRVSIPLDRLDLGPAQFSVSLPGGAVETLTAFVSLGVDIPVDSVAELLDALRHFVSESELQRLRAASPATRPGLWAAMLRRLDPNTATPDNEAFLEYARRLRVAERSFREKGAHGWQTDRGSVMAALGEPDHITEPLPSDSTGATRLVTWEYRRHRLFLVFAEVTGTELWRLIPVSAAELRSFLALAGPCVGCR